MPRIKTDSLHVGMVVTHDVRNLDNLLLIPANTTLTARQISILQAWGVTEVEVGAGELAAEAGGPLSQLPAETVARITAEVKGRFWQLDETSPVQLEIFTLALRRRAEKSLAADKRTGA